MIANSTPSFAEFNPTVIPMQADVLRRIRDANYSLGTHEILLSGSVGSAKSILMAHVVVRHCLENSRARVLIGRRALPDLKDTLFTKILEHLEDIPATKFKVNYSSARIRFSNGSEIISRSWADKHYSKLRSLELSMAAIEELTENDGDDEQAYHEIKMRVGRLPHIKTPLIISATNPDSPGHWAYKYFIQPESHPTRHVFYSRTEDNPFLPRSYIEQLKADMDPKTALRMLYGQWVEIRGEVVYYEYNRDSQFRNLEYQINKQHPIILTWDFNIGEGKPMSMACMQYINDTFHVFDEVIISGSRTADTIEELDGKGLLQKDCKYIICGDASGKHRDTRSSQSDYDIIRKELSNRNLSFEYHVPLSNPPVRTRHNRVNAYCQNMNGDVRLFIYKNAKTCDEAMRLTKLKSGASYIEDDSKAYQHVGTAIGYAIIFESNKAQRKPQGTTFL